MILKNIEIKAKIRDFNKIKNIVDELDLKLVEIEHQTDTFFNNKKGRLKLREGKNTSALIYYDRPNSTKPTQSDIAISFSKDSITLKEVLSKSIGIRGIVRKKRILYLYGQTRIHLDDVEGLGKFIELEVVLEKNQSVGNGESIANDLMDKLGIQKSDLMDVAYIDLLESNN